MISLGTLENKLRLLILEITKNSKINKLLIIYNLIIFYFLTNLLSLLIFLL